MHFKNVLSVVAGLAVIAEAAEIHSRSPYARALNRRRFDAERFGRNGRKQFDGGNGGNGQNDGNGQNGGNGQDGGNNGQDGGNNGGNNGGNGGNGGGSTLSPDVIQTGSQQDGNNPGSAEQAASATDNNNFINFCQGKTLTNGAQVKTGSCNGIVMGNIPATDKMVASVFTNPKNGDDIAANTDFSVDVQMIGLAAGSFVNATTNYYSAPQDVDGNGNIIGHTHVTIQSTGDTLNPTTPLDPTQFVFFKGINDAGNGQGLLSAPVAGGLPAGNYRLCSMSAASNHQPVLMPVAQRGAQDDCVRFTVGAGNGGNNGGNAGNGQDAGNGQNGGNAGNGQDAGNGQNGGNAGNGQDAGNGQNGGNGQDAGNGQNGGNGQDAGNGQNGGNGQDGGNGQNGGDTNNAADPNNVATTTAAPPAETTAAATAAPTADPNNQGGDNGQNQGQDGGNGQDQGQDGGNNGQDQGQDGGNNGQDQGQDGGNNGQDQGQDGGNNGQDQGQDGGNGQDQGQDGGSDTNNAAQPNNGGDDAGNDCDGN